MRGNRQPDNGSEPLNPVRTPLQAAGWRNDNNQSTAPISKRKSGSNARIILDVGASRPLARRRHQCLAARRSAAVIKKQTTARSVAAPASHLKSFILANPPLPGDSVWRRVNALVE